MTLLSALRAFCSQHGRDNTYWIGYSGGLDSQVLLSLCQTLRQTFPLKLHAIHINHGLSPHAHRWSAHCARTCQDYGIPLVERTIQLETTSGKSLEEAAREQRYAVFAEHLNAGDILLTAHQQDDQAETLLLQLVRGAGVKGLASMPVIKPFAHGFHGRPLLAFSRAELQRYAEAEQLQWIEDESNANTQFTRNFIRADIMPLLKSRWPSVTETLARSAAHCAEAQTLLQELAQESEATLQGSQAGTLSVAKLLALRPDKQKLMLRAWLQNLGYPLPDTKKIAAIQRDVLTAAWDRLPCVRWQGAEVRRYRDDLFVMSCLPATPQTTPVEWDVTKPLALPGIGTLQSSPVCGQGLRADIKNVVVMFRQGGESVELPGRGRHTLKNLFQEWNVLPWMRARIPLVFVDEQLVSAVGYFVNADFAAKKDEMGRMIFLT